MLTFSRQVFLTLIKFKSMCNNVAHFGRVSLDMRIADDIPYVFHCRNLDSQMFIVFALGCVTCHVRPVLLFWQFCIVLMWFLLLNFNVLVYIVLQRECRGCE